MPDMVPLMRINGDRRRQESAVKSTLPILRSALRAIRERRGPSPTSSSPTSRATPTATWKTTGTAFGKGPAKGTLPNQMPVSGFLGKGLVNSYLGGDGTTGTLTSPRVQVERKYLNFLVGGGKHAGKTCINLLVDGKVVRTATGPNDKPGGSEQLDWHTWDVAEFEGKDATSSRSSTTQTGGWGHINVDHIVQSDAKKQAEPVRARVRASTSSYLHLPVKNGEPRSGAMKFVVGRARRSASSTSSWPTAKPDFWVFADVSRVQGQDADGRDDAAGRLEGARRARSRPTTCRTRRSSTRRSTGRSSTSRRGAAGSTTRTGWSTTTASGTCSTSTTPTAASWGNMHWGHAVSKDLVRWKELRHRPLPEEVRRLGLLRQRPSWTRTTRPAGARRTKPPLVLAYTSTGRGECIAYSNDQRPHLDGVRQEPGGEARRPRPEARLARAEQALGDGGLRRGRQEAVDRLLHLAGPEDVDVREPHRGLLRVPRPVRAAGRRRRRSRRSGCCTGPTGSTCSATFDGKAFKPESRRSSSSGTATSTRPRRSTTPAGRAGRAIQIGWAQGVTFPGMPFNQQMTVPVELELRNGPDGPRLLLPGRSRNWPRSATRSRRSRSGSQSPVTIDGARTLADNLDAFEVRSHLDVGKSDGFTLDLRGTKLIYDARKGTLTCKDVTAPVKLPMTGNSPSGYWWIAGPSRCSRTTAVSLCRSPRSRTRRTASSELIPHGGEITHQKRRRLADEVGVGVVSRASRERERPEEAINSGRSRSRLARNRH